MKRRAFLSVVAALAVVPAFAQSKPMKIGVIGSGDGIVEWTCLDC